MKLDFHHKFVNYLTSNGWLDHWTAVHMAAGAFICKVALWGGASKLSAVLWVAVIGVLFQGFTPEALEEVERPKEIK